MSVHEQRDVAVDCEADFARWCDEQARALRGRRWHALDVDALADELEAMSRAERRRLESDLTVLLTHLLKLEHQPERSSRSWSLSVREHARRVVRQLAESPSMTSVWEETVEDAYDAARLRAAIETELPLESFPSVIEDATAARLDDALAAATAELDDRRRRRRSRETD